MSRKTRWCLSERWLLSCQDNSHSHWEEAGQFHGLAWWPSQHHQGWVIRRWVNSCRAGPGASLALELVVVVVVVVVVVAVLPLHQLWLLHPQHCQKRFLMLLLNWAGQVCSMTSKKPKWFRSDWVETRKAKNQWYFEGCPHWAFKDRMHAWTMLHCQVWLVHYCHNLVSCLFWLFLIFAMLLFHKFCQWHKHYPWSNHLIQSKRQGKNMRHCQNTWSKPIHIVTPREHQTHTI